MKPQFLPGAILILVGVLVLVFQGLPFVKKNTIEAGPAKVETRQQEVLPIPGILGVVSLAGGIFLVVLGSRK